MEKEDRERLLPLSPHPPALALSEYPLVLRRLMMPVGGVVLLGILLCDCHRRRCHQTDHHLTRKKKRRLDEDDEHEPQGG